MFGWKKTPQVELSDDAYKCWLRAQRPPLIWFLGLEPEVQESLAKHGDEFLEDFCIAIGYAALDPAAASAGLDAETHLEAEEFLVRRMAQGVAQQMTQGGSPSTPAAISALDKTQAPPSMGGVGKRKQETATARQKEASEHKSFLGRKPDAARSNSKPESSREAEA